MSGSHRADVVPQVLEPGAPDRARRAWSEQPPRRRYHVPPGTWDVERIIAALRDWAELVGDPPRVLDWCPVERSEPTYRAHLWERHYPRWPEHCSACIPTSSASTCTRNSADAQRTTSSSAASAPDAPTVEHRHDHGRARICSRRSCAGAISRAAPRPASSGRRGQIPAAAGSAYTPDWPTVKDVQRDFGSWNQALRAAGITPVHPIGVAKADVLAALRDAHADLGDKLSYKSYTAWASGRHRPSTAPLVRHFGTFNNARQAAGIPGPP